MTKIYTRTGDKGKTSLRGGKRVSKADIRVEAYGTIDELNSALGLALAYILGKETGIKALLESVQDDLFEIGSYLSDPSAKKCRNFIEKITEFEEAIDEQTKMLPPLRNFILPGGSIVGASLHHCRTVCRRAERRIVAFAKTHEVDESVLTYLNRLSDVLFSSARYMNHIEGNKEIIWTNKS